MNQVLARLIGGLLLLCAALWVSPALAQNARLEKGEVIVVSQEVKDSDIPRVVATAMIKAKPEEVWALIEKCDNYTQTMQRVLKSKEISRKGKQVRCEVQVDLPWPLDDLTAVTDAVHTVRPGQLYRRRWSLVSGDYDFNNGSWEIRPYGDDPTRSLVTYTLHVKPKTAVPDAIKAKAQQSSLPDLFEHLRSQLEGK